MTGLTELAVAYIIMIGIIGGYVWNLFSKLKDIESRIEGVEINFLKEESEDEWYISHENTSKMYYLGHYEIITCQRARFVLLVAQNHLLLLVGCARYALEKETTSLQSLRGYSNTDVLSVINTK